MSGVALAEGKLGELALRRRLVAVQRTRAITKRNLLWNNAMPKIEVEKISPIGAVASRSAKERASPASPMTVQGTTTFCSRGPDHST